MPDTSEAAEWRVHLRECHGTKVGRTWSARLMRATHDDDYPDCTWTSAAHDRARERSFQEGKYQ